MKTNVTADWHYNCPLKILPTYFYYSSVKMYNLLDSLLFGHVSLHIQTTLFYLCKAYLLPYWNGKTFQWKFHKSQFIIRYHLQLDIIYLLNGLQTILLWVKVKSLSRVPPTLCDPMDYTVHGLLQARTLEWVAFPFSRRSSQPRHWTQVSCITGRFFTRWATWEAQEYWSG